MANEVTLSDLGAQLVELVENGLRGAGDGVHTVIMEGADGVPLVSLKVMLQEGKFVKLLESEDL